jgi:hypothetical protein
MMGSNETETLMAGIGDFLHSVLNEVTGGAQSALGARAANASPAASATAAPAPAFVPMAVGSFDTPPSGIDAANADIARPMGAPMHGNPADRLPARAREKYLAICSSADDAAALLRVSSERVNDAQMDVMRAEARLRQLGDRRAMDADDAARQDAERKGAAARATVERLRAESERRSEASLPLRELRFALERYAQRELASVNIIEAAPIVATPQLRKGENYHDLVTATRAKLEGLRDELAAVEAATLPADVAKQKARAQIAELAGKGKPHVLELLEGRKQFSFAKVFRAGEFAYDHAGQIAGRASRDRYEDDALATLCWLFERELTAAIEREIDEHSDPSSALTDEQIVKKRGQLHSAIIQVQREEEAAIEAGSQAGISIPRRPDADPRAVLGLSDAMPAPRG